MSLEKKISILVIICLILILFPIVVFAEGVETYTVSFNSMGGSDTASIIAESGTTITKPADPSWQGHYFCGWFKEEGCINEWRFDTDPVTSDITLFAAWKDCYTISASSTDPAMAAPSASAAAGGYRSVRVLWDAVSGASGYEVYRSATPDGTFSKVYTFMSSEASRYTDYSLTADSTYYYKVRAYRTADSGTSYSDYSAILSAKASFVTPSLNAVSASDTSIRLTWDELSGVSGYELYRCTSKYGRYAKIYTAKSAPTIIYTNTSLTNGATYYFKIRAYGREGNSKKIYGPYSPAVSAVPSTTLPERTFTILYQGDPQWGFPDYVRHVACLMSSYAITINNMGIPATPRTVYESNGNSTVMNYDNLATNFGVKTVCAVDLCSPYLMSTNIMTYIKNPSSNATAAIKEALNKYPDGVICYFKRGDDKHAIVACKYDGDIIYYSDPGRTRKTLLTFSDTWVWYHHRMDYGNLAYIVALEKIND